MGQVTKIMSKEITEQSNRNLDRRHRDREKEKDNLASEVGGGGSVRGADSNDKK